MVQHETLFAIGPAASNDFDSGKLDAEYFSKDEMYDYIVSWGEGESVEWIKDNFNWKTLTSELGLR